MANTDKILLEFGLDQESFKKLMKDVSSSFSNSFKASFDAVQDSTNKISRAAQGLKFAEAGVKKLKDGLEAGGLSLVEVERKTRAFDTTLLRLNVRLEQLRGQMNKEGADFDKIGQKIGSVEERIERLQRTIGKTHVGDIIKSTDAQKLDSFIKNFAFNVGLAAYALGNVGRQMTGFSMQIANLAQQSAQSTEPLERIINLLNTENVDPSKLKAYVAEIRKIADMPGANLEKVSESLRVLLPLGRTIPDTLKLVEGLTKAAALSGTGADGVSRLAAQLRQFSASKELRELDIKAIQEQGGKPVVDVLKAAFGDASATTLTAAGPEAVINALTEGLNNLKTPALTATDRINQLKNAVLSLGMAFNTVTGPALEKLVDFLRTNVEPLVASLTEKFNKLTESQKLFVSAMVVGIPVAIGAIGGLLSVISFLGIGLAGFNKAFTDLKLGFKFFTPAAEEATVAIKTLTRAGTAAEAMAMGVGESFRFLWSYTKVINAGKGGFLSALTFFINGGPKIAGALQLITPSLKVLGVTLGKVFGLIPGIGTVINTLLGLLTNAGNSRDNLGSALGSLWEQLKNFGTLLGQWFSGQGIIGGILSFLLQVSDVISGALANSLVVLIKQLTSIVELLNVIGNFEFSTDWFTNFGTALIRASIKWIDDISSYFAASLIEKLADAMEYLQNKLGTTGAVLAGTGGASVGALRQSAADMRDRVNRGGWGFDNGGWLANGGIRREGTGDLNSWSSTKSWLDSQGKSAELNRSSEKVTELLYKMSNAIAKSTLAFNQVSASVEAAKIKIANNDFQRASDAKIQEMISRQSPGTRAQILGAYEQSNAAARREINSQLLNTLSSIKIDAGDQYSALNKSLPSYRFGGASAFKDKAKQLADFMQSGQMDKEGLMNLFNASTQAFNEYKNSVSGSLDEKEIKDLEKALQIFQNLRDVANQYHKAISDSEIQILNTVETNKKRRDAQLEELRLEEKKREALERAAKPQRELAELQANLAENQATLATGQFEKTEDFLDLQNLIANQKSEEIRLNKEISSILDEVKNKNQEVANATKESTEAIATRAAIEREELANLQSYNDLLKSSFEVGINALDDYVERYKQINDERAKMGLGPLAEASGIPLQKDILELRKMESGGFGRVFNSLGLVNSFKQNNGILPDSIVSDLKSKFSQIQKSFQIDLGRSTGLDSDLLGLQRSKGAAITDLEKDNIDKQIKAKTLEQLKLNAAIKDEANALAFISGLLNKHLATRNKEVALKIKQNEADQVNIQREIELLTLQDELDKSRANNTQLRAGLDGKALTSLQEQNLLNQAKYREIELIEQKYQLQVKEVELAKIKAAADLASGTINRAAYDKEIEILNKKLLILGLINTEAKEGVDLQSQSDKINAYANSLDNVMNKYVKLMQMNFAEWLQKSADGQLKAGDTIKVAGELIANVAAISLGAAFQSLATAWISFLEGGDSFLGGFGKFLGSFLMMLGEMLIQMSAAAAIKAFMDALFDPTGPPSIWAKIGNAFAAMAAVAPMAAVGIGAGTALILAGRSMGGSGSYSSASKNTANGASAATGATGQTKYDPEKDPQYIYQKAMSTQVIIDIRHDDGMIVKKVIKAVNRNGRLSNMIGNRQMGFQM